jgi:FG-GAP-like repeat
VPAAGEGATHRAGESGIAMASLPASPVHPLVALVICLAFAPTVAASGAALQRHPLHRETELDRSVIVTPSTPEYEALGRELAEAIRQRTGVLVEVDRAEAYVSGRPRAVKGETLGRHFILVGQFWNNAILERLYAGMFDPTDALFPGPGGHELRTVCRPFRAGQNCVVVTGSDIEGCRQAAAALPGLLVERNGAWVIPFLHQVQLGGEAATAEAAYRERVAGFVADMGSYSVFRGPRARTWTGEDPRDFLVWHDRNLAAAAVFGLRFWATGDPLSAQAFRRLVLGCRAELSRLEQAYGEGRSDLIEYSLDGLTIAWDLIEETDAFSDAERGQITDYLFQLAYLNRDKYFVYKCLDRPLDEVMFYNRHQIAGTFWMGIAGEYFVRNCLLSPDQLQLAEYWVANAQHYLKRLSQSYFYSDGVALMHDEGGLVLRYALRTGNLDLVDNGNLRLLADYWVANHDNLGFESSSGHNGFTRRSPQAGEVLNVADWLLPGEGYEWFRRQLGRWPYEPFLFYASTWAGFGFPYYNWETPATDGGAEGLRSCMTGISVLPLGPGFDAYLRRYPDLWQGGYQRVAGRYVYQPIPYEQSWKRIALRSGFGRDDQYLVLDGMQGVEWSYDDLNALVQYDDLGERLLKSQWDARNVESRLEMNTLFVSSGVPAQKQSVAGQLRTAYDGGPYALLASTAALHDGVAWTRRLFWQKQGWIAIADEVVPQADGDHFLAQTWLSWYPFTTRGTEATAKAGEITLHIAGTPGRELELAEGGEGTRQKAWARLTEGRPLTLWTLLSATGPRRPAASHLRQIGPQVALVRKAADGMTPETALLFSGEVGLGGLRVVADMGVLTKGSLTLAGCRELSVDRRALLGAVEGVSFSWDLAASRFEPSRAGFGMQSGGEPPGLGSRQRIVAAALGRCLAAAAQAPAYQAPELSQPGPPKAPALAVTQRLALPPPVSLASGDLQGNGLEELALYGGDRKPRLDLPAFRGQPVLVDLDGNRHPDIAFALPGAVAVYHQDGTLRWQKALTNPAAALSAGDLDGDGRQELGLSQHNWATVLNHAGEAMIDEEVYRYNGVGGAFGDVDGDGAAEFVAVTTSGVNVLRPGRTRQTVGFQSYIGTSPCRVWLRDLDGDGVSECYIGGRGTDAACYDLRAMKCRWAFPASLHPRDIALCDVDGDGAPEVVAGGADSFLYVLGRDGQFRLSRSVGGAITALCTVPGRDGEALAVGLATGHMLLLGRDLKPIGSAPIDPPEPVTQLTVLPQEAGRIALVAASDSGACLWADVGP